MAFKDVFEDLIEEGKMTKAMLLDMLDSFKAQNTTNLIILTDDEYNTIKSRINASNLPS